MSLNETQWNQMLLEVDSAGYVPGETSSEEELLEAVAALIDNIDEQDEPVVEQDEPVVEQVEEQVDEELEEGEVDEELEEGEVDEPDEPNEPNEPEERSLNLEEIYSEDNMSCSVCYKELKLDNIVNTMCNHVYCKTCFFKWMKQAYNCPMCRRNFISLEKWYEGNDLNAEITNERRLSQILQQDSVVLSKRCRDLQKENKELSFWNKQNLQRQITLTQQIEYTEGYVFGFNDNPEIENNERKIHFEACSNSPWFQGFTKGLWKLNNLEKKKKNIDSDGELSDVSI
jgi:hypothetical protein